ncbi:hypothetical protein D3C87_1602900 [compost metagenome]
MGGFGVSDIEFAFGQGTRVTRRDDQVLTAFAAIRPWQAQVDDPTEPCILNRAKDTRRDFHHYRPIREVESGDDIDRVGVGR